MNYRHHFHAGNFADVFKHALLLDALARLQRKDKGILYLDTHAGRGMYNLGVADVGDRLARQPEHPEGWGRVHTAAAQLPALLRDYAAVVEEARGGDQGLYPGSPALVAARLRPQDRMHLCERHPDDHAALAARFGRRPRTAVNASDGYGAVRATLPPPERRALILIDPPFEEQDEYAQITVAVNEALDRLPGATIAVWHPISERANPADFLTEVRAEGRVPTLWATLEIAGQRSLLKMRGCGLIVFNPPWGVEQDWSAAIQAMGRLLAQEPGAAGRLSWVVAER